MHVVVTFCVHACVSLYITQIESVTAERDSFNTELTNVRAQLETCTEVRDSILYYLCLFA